MLFTEHEIASSEISGQYLRNKRNNFVLPGYPTRTQNTLHEGWHKGQPCQRDGAVNWWALVFLCNNRMPFHLDKACTHIYHAATGILQFACERFPSLAPHRSVPSSRYPDLAGSGLSTYHRRCSPYAHVDRQGNLQTEFLADNCQFIPMVFQNSTTMVHRT